MHGRAEIVFETGRLGHLYQRAPLRVLFPTPPEGEPIQAALVTTSGGLAGGDRLDLEVRTGADASGVVVASAAEKIYRSIGPDTHVQVHLTAEAGSWLEFLPQETILFEGARLRRALRLDLATGARAMVGEILAFGRAARGESLTTGLVRDAWEIHRDGRLVWAEALHLDGDLAARLKAAAGLGGATACATLVLAAPDPDGLCCLVRSLLEDHQGRAGASVINDLLIVRWLDEDGARLRKSYGMVWAALRQAAAGLPNILPRIWEV
jgi:urease accessory protein